MKKNRFRIFLTVLFIVGAIIKLYPTYQDTQYNKEYNALKKTDDSAKFVQDSANFYDKYSTSLISAKENRIKLGLDLQGGMYVIMEVDVAKLMQDLAKRKDDNFNQVINETSEQVKNSDENFIDVFEAKLLAKGMSLKAYYGEIRDDDKKIKSDLSSEVDNAIDRAVEVVRNRIDQYGVAEPVIQKKGNSRLVVELPGISNVEDVRKLLQGTALLEFKLEIEPAIAVKIMKKIDTYLAGGNLDSLNRSDSLKTLADLKKKDTAITKIKQDTSKITQKDTTKKKTEQKKETPDKNITKKDVKKDTSKKNITSKDTSKKKDITSTDTGTSTDTTAENEMDTTNFKMKHPWFYIVLTQQYQDGSVGFYVRETDKPTVTRILERKEIQEIIPPDVSFNWGNRTVNDKEGGKIYQLHILKKEPELTGGVVVNARSNIDPTSNQPVVQMEMNSEGSADWARITGANINKKIAIVLDNVVYSDPSVRNKITGGNSEITGIGDIKEAKLLEIVLKAGALPAPLKIIEERTVGPSLGEDSINKGLYSSLIALLLVATFMVVYYHFGGGVADLALMFNMLFVLGVMASFKATLTLPGLAGLILTIGMAVDSNVLIYERIREELNGGKPIKTAIEIGYKKAFSAILDSHVTSLITGVILYQFGSGPIQGFALTLIIGLIANLFTSIVITRIIFDILTERGKSHINFG